jgi:CubicO group peptidase (beta-lactamase class C family)
VSTPSRVATALLLLLLLITEPAATPLSQPDVSSAPLRSSTRSPVTQIDAFLTRLVALQGFSGAVLVARKGHILLSKGYGGADLDRHVPNTPTTEFRIGSITKQFTALAILLLQEQGKLHVTDHLCRYVPQCPKDWQPITIHQLLTHTSGIPNYTALPGYVAWKMYPATPTQLIAHVKDKPLDFKPGTRWRYSNSGYVLLGYIIEKVSGESYATFLQQHIFAPLRLSHTGYDQDHPALPHHATGYTSWDAPATYAAVSVYFAAGGLYSTVEDLYRWDHALLTRTVIPKTLVQTLFTPFVTICREHCDPFASGVHPTRVSYGYGWGISQGGQRRAIGHPGRVEGFVALNQLYPDDKAIVIVLSNLQSAALDVIGVAIAKDLFGKG